ncbi:MAG: hypothetical protein WA708_21385 [Acidobacteriaceae bacterium]
MIVDNDRWNAHKVCIAFTDKVEPAQAFSGLVQLSIFWPGAVCLAPCRPQTMAHYRRINPALETVYPHGHANPDGPMLHETKDETSATE